MARKKRTSPKPSPSKPEPGLRPFVWWLLWAALLTGFAQVWYYAQSVHPRAPSLMVALVAVVVAAGMLLVSMAIRWLLLPRIPRIGVAFVFFLIGQALAEGCGYVGLFLSGAMREALFATGAVGLVQYVPWFVRRFYARSGTGAKP